MPMFSLSETNLNDAYPYEDHRRLGKIQPPNENRFVRGSDTSSESGGGGTLYYILVNYTLTIPTSSEVDGSILALQLVKLLSSITVDGCNAVISSSTEYETLQSVLASDVTETVPPVAIDDGELAKRVNSVPIYAWVLLAVVGVLISSALIYAVVRSNRHNDRHGLHILKSTSLKPVNSDGEISSQVAPHTMARRVLVAPTIRIIEERGGAIPEEKHHRGLCGEIFSEPNHKISIGMDPSGSNHRVERRCSEHGSTGAEAPRRHSMVRRSELVRNSQTDFHSHLL